MLERRAGKLMRGLATLAPLLALLAACSSGSGNLMVRSCNGHVVPNCLPFEYTAVRTASVQPAELPVGDLTVGAQIHVEVESCGTDAPGTLFVTVTAVTDDGTLAPDGGPLLRDFHVLELRDDGMGGDAMAGDGVIFKNAPNPFDNRLIPGNTDILLRFEPQRTATCAGGSCTGGTCAGEPFELNYRTGPLAPRLPGISGL